MSALGSYFVEDVFPDASFYICRIPVADLQSRNMNSVRPQYKNLIKEGKKYHGHLDL